MKFVHIADMHFDAPFSNLNNSQLADTRRLEQRQALKEAITYIQENNIPYLLIAGDVYEHEYIRQSTIEYINQLFLQIPNTKIYIAPGNHDPYLKESYYSTYSWAPNVTIFKGEIEKIQNQDVTIYGYGFEDFYCSDTGIEEIELEEKDKINIGIFHGSLDAQKSDISYNPMSSAKLENIGFDYIALGHIHKNNYEQDNRIVYPGSFISFGFDELGQHGMIAGEIEKGKMKLEFISLDKRIYEEIKIDISELYSQEELIEKLNTLFLNEKNIYKIILTGNKNFEINLYSIFQNILNKNIIKIKDHTQININLENIAMQNNLKGIFVRECLDKIQEESNNREKIEKALELGLEALGNEV